MDPFPLKTAQFRHDFGIKALKPNEPLLQRSDHFNDEITLKNKLLRIDPDNYFYASSDNSRAYLNAAKELLNWPNAFDAQTHDQLVAEFRSVETADQDPHRVIGLFHQVAAAQQADVVLLSAAAEDCFAVLGGMVVFPSGWSIRDKIGLSMLQTHGEVPGYQQHLHQSTQRLLERMRPGRPVWRSNWGIRPTELLDQSPKNKPIVKQAALAVDCQNAGWKCFFRVEHQTLSLLPSGDASRPDSIMFTIQTTQKPLDKLTSTQIRLLLGVLETCPLEVLRYKSISDFFDPLRQYLRARL